jgi:SSS family solute:Na+ symporter
MNINGIDFSIIIFYLFFIVGLGCWVGIRNRRKTQANSYFLAGQSLRWPVIGLALFATNISTVHLVSLAEEGYTNGLAYGNFEWMAAFALILLALFFAPFYIRSRVTTLPDFLEKRYSRASRDWLSLLSIISAIFIHIGFSLYAGAVVIEGMFGIDKMVSILIIAGLTGLYTIVGGLMAVVLTESIQTIIMVIGAIVLTAIAYFEAGGWSGISASVDPHLFTVLRPHGDPSGIPWYSMLLGYPVIGIWYWCTDQTIVQRVLGAKDENNARRPAVCRIY